MDAPMDSSNQYLRILGDRDPEVTKGSEGSLKFVYQSGTPMTRKTQRILPHFSLLLPVAVELPHYYVWVFLVIGAPDPHGPLQLHLLENFLRQN